MKHKLCTDDIEPSVRLAMSIEGRERKELHVAFCEDDVSFEVAYKEEGKCCMTTTRDTLKEAIERYNEL